MRCHCFVFFTAIAMLLMGATYAQVPASSDSILLSRPNATSGAAARMKLQGPLDEQLEVELTYPIPITQAPVGCVMTLIERYCRADNELVTSFLVLHQRTVGRSSIEKITIDNGCLVAEVKLGVGEDRTGNAQCVGGEPSVRLRLLISAHPTPKL
ncbi:MAG: hypothetical protein DID92_2727745556 [Candidatus Nitrotoga sp. SPKER]|nr:MAG: hypothetical protein DID92_2727745556 [Candidatus Nitrotoga sp. SPKER]